MSVYKELTEMEGIRSRLKSRARAMRTVGNLHEALRCLEAAYVLEDDLIEKSALRADLGLLEFEWLASARPDLKLRVHEAKQRVLEAHRVMELPVPGKKRKK